MRSRVLYLPSRISPEASESIAFYRAILDDLRTEYDVDIFRWPFITGGPDIEPTWEALTSAIRDAITPGCHVVALGICTIPAMLALGSGWSKAASFTALALFLSPGTLRALGMFALADAA